MSTGSDESALVRIVSLALAVVIVASMLFWLSGENGPPPAAPDERKTTPRVATAEELQRRRESAEIARRAAWLAVAHPGPETESERLASYASPERCDVRILLQEESRVIARAIDDKTADRLLQLDFEAADPLEQADVAASLLSGSSRRVLQRFARCRDNEPYIALFAHPDWSRRAWMVAVGQHLMDREIALSRVQLGHALELLDAVPVLVPPPCGDSVAIDAPAAGEVPWYRQRTTRLARCSTGDHYRYSPESGWAPATPAG